MGLETAIYSRCEGWRGLEETEELCFSLSWLTNLVSLGSFPLQTAHEVELRANI